jgi:MoaA/NifB/PqqE/SkfB family radical SAM enzyme
MNFQNSILTNKEYNSAFHNKHEALTDMIYSGELKLPHRYVLVLTNLCNLNCSFCFQKRDKRPDAMTGDQWIKFLDQIPEYARVTLTGGEPFAFKEFSRVFEYATDSHHTNLISNGLLLDKKRIDLLLSKPNFKVLSISIDDIGNLNRDVKPLHWERFLKAIEYFHVKRNQVKSNCLLDIKTVLLDSNAHQLLKIHKFCVEVLKADTHAFQFLKGSSIQHSDIMVDLEEIHKIEKAPVYENFKDIFQQLELIRQYNKTSTASAFVHPKICNLEGEHKIKPQEYLNASSFEPKEFQLCKFPWSSVHINVDGNLFPCMSVSMGNVKDKKLIEIMMGKKFSEFKKTLKQNLVQGCNRCGWIRRKANQ